MAFAFEGGAPDPYAQFYGVQPHYAYYAPPPQPAPIQQQPAPAADEVRTVFVSGFPDDVRERELNNMLRFLAGYEASQMHFRNGQAQGFALFETGSLARAAVDAIQNLVFDNDCVLRAEMAHKNMYVKDDPSAAPKRSRPSSYPEAPPNNYPGAFAPPAAPAPAPYGHAPFNGMPAAAPAPAAVAPMQPRGYAPISNTKDNPPCNTLFIGNLGDATNEAEMRSLFSHQPGFQQLKLVRGQKGLSCFIEFADIPTAMAVHDAQQGAILSTSDRGGIRIQYSKNPFGRKRDAAGAFVAEAAPQGYAMPAGGQAAAAAAAAAAATAHPLPQPVPPPHADGGPGGQQPAQAAQ
ncbi:hypothetical protein D9Q98_003351 [Chlorella vulgaris]|uniref:RRM domain-containing protein n=1 Tax=Chlorella vulgaris TaxID=3077 RepID=A0A9D4TSQ4_CHLVU|nr:hypothetical protein D9Q98_003351 [Chlorella vulgaris]